MRNFAKSPCGRQPCPLERPDASHERAGGVSRRAGDASAPHPSGTRTQGAARPRVRHHLDMCDPQSIFSKQHSEATMIEHHVSGFIERLRRSWRRSLRRRRALDELAACPPSELNRMAADVGVSGEELYRLARYADWPSELLPRRLELLGVDAAYVRQAMPTTFRDLTRVCANCRSSRRCRQDLARGDAQAGQVSYCLNAATIDVLTLNRDDREIRNATRGAA